ncbi:MAG: response regulator transcription factor [Ferruginibacter sp.]|nr:response regulator transcription factor [Cytophagales bacterium]
MKIRCLTVDDEHLALQLLAEYIGKVPSLELVNQCRNAQQALEVLKTGEIDLLFLDIQMPNLSGVELVQLLRRKPLTVFTTAYSEYAVEGFRLDAIDYLLKPFSFERFTQAVNKAADAIEIRRENGEEMSPGQPALTKATGEMAAPAHFFVKADYKLVKVRFADILYIEGLKEYVSIYTVAGRLVTLQSLKNLADTLPVGEFMRIHKSYIVPLARIEALVGNQVEINKTLLPIGPTYRELVLAALGLN